MSASNRVVVGDLTLDRAREALHGELADIVYVDPPWGPGLLQYFRTMCGDGAPVDWPAFLKNFCEIAAASIVPDGHVFIEMGLQWAEELSEAMAAAGIAEHERWPVQYGSPKRPNALLYSGPGAPCSPSRMSGTAMTKHVLASVAKPGALVFDPCCGKGMTARCAVQLGMRFSGVELVSKRAHVTQEWLDGRVNR